jgi:type II restriction/modification system DNA methylase subunit YeeA
MGAGRFFITVGPEQLHGIEVNEYAHELAQVTIWIGYIQWRLENGYGFSEPILRPMQTIVQMDAVLGRPDRSQLALGQAEKHGVTDALAGKTARGDLSGLVEPTWPPVDVIIGNPPFLGGKRLRAELGNEYVDGLFALYDDRVPHEADLVCYWFEKARAMVENGQAQRAGLLATNSIRGGANRRVLERIKQSGDIFWAQSDREWILDGAAVNVSMIGFDKGIETFHWLDDKVVQKINADLTFGLLTKK